MPVLLRARYTIKGVSSPLDLGPIDHPASQTPFSLVLPDLYYIGPGHQLLGPISRPRIGRPTGVFAAWVPAAVL